MGNFTIRMDDKRKERVFKFRKLYQKAFLEEAGTQARVYDLALDIANKRLEEVVSTKENLGVRVG